MVPLVSLPMNVSQNICSFYWGEKKNEKDNSVWIAIVNAEN